MKRICTEPEELDKNLRTLKSTLVSRGYNENHIDDQLEKVQNIERIATLDYKEKSNELQKIPFVTNFNKHNPNIREIIDKNWHLLQLDETTGKAFAQKPIIAYRRNKNLRDLLGQTTISNNLVKRPKARLLGKCKPCKPNRNKLCCKQLISTNKVMSTVTKRSHNIYDNTNCKTSYLIYVMQCMKCNIQYVGKSEPAFEIRLNNHRADAYNTDSENKTIIPACKHFHQTDHDFNRDARFVLVEKVKDPHLSKQDKRTLLLQRENFWITLLDTLKPKGFNIKLNKV